MNRNPSKLSDNSMGRRELLTFAALGSVAIAAGGATNAVAEASGKPADVASRVRNNNCRFKKSINLRAFPYPDQLSLRECLSLAKEAGFDGVELNHILESDDQSSERSLPFSKCDFRNLQSIKVMAQDIGIQLSGLRSSLFHIFPLTSLSTREREKGIELTGNLIRVAHELGVTDLQISLQTSALLSRPADPPISYDQYESQARASISRLLAVAEEFGIHLSIENSGHHFLTTAEDVTAFVDSFSSDYLHVQFVIDRVPEYQQTEHWISQLGNRIRNVQLTEKRQQENVDQWGVPCCASQGNANRNAMTSGFFSALDQIKYTGFVTVAGMLSNQQHWETLTCQTADSMDRMLSPKS